MPQRHAQLMEGLIRQRPITAANMTFPTEELRSVFESTLRRYRELHGKIPVDGEKIHCNTGVNFEENWHERVLQRHMLLRMQRLLRVHAAQHRRHMLQQQRIKSAPPHKTALTGQQPPPPSRQSRPNTAHPSLLRTHAATATPSAPTPSPAPPTGPTAGAGEARVPSLSQQKEQMHKQRQQLLAYREKMQLGEEQPFRLRLGGPAERSPRRPGEHRVRMDPKMLDPRNPSAIRPRSSKSIPSKCSRYVLLSRPRTAAEVPVPTALEEELMATRFPDQSVRLLHSAGTALRPTPPTTAYGITYTPFSMYG